MRNLVLLFCLVTSCGWSAQPAITEWMERYYITRDDSRLAELWDRTVARGALNKEPQMREKLIGFFGAAFRTHPDLLRSRIVEVPKEQGIAQDSITIILWLSDSDYSKALLKTAGFSKVAGTPIPGVSGRRIIHADDVDFLYGWYCATGDTAALEPMLNYVLKADWSVPDSKPGYAAAMLQYFCEKDLRAWTHVAEFVRAHPVDGELSDLFNAMLKTKPANKSLEPMGIAVTPRAGARVAPAIPMAHH